MTNSAIEPRPGDGPYYLRLADGIEASIAEGALVRGLRLPPQRNLAYDLGVTVGTVSRAYGLLRERGLVSGEVGRGTYVQTDAPDAAAAPIEAEFGGTRVHEAPAGKQRFDSTAAPDVDQSAVLGPILATVMRDHPLSVANYSRMLPEAWLKAGQTWLARNDWTPPQTDVVPTLGVHSGVLAVVAALTAPGDRIVFEALTYSQMARSVRRIGRRITIVETDDHGMVPEDFERVCAQQHPKMAFLIPTLHNPTLAIMPEERRRQIARIAARHDVWLIEDDIYGGLSDDPTPLIATFAPERTFVVNGLSKSVAAGLRGGWVACPPHQAQRINVTHKMLTGGLPFVLTEAAARLVLSGAADDIRTRALEEIAARQAIAAKTLEGYDFATNPCAPYIWLKLPETWLSGTFRAAALDQDLLVDDEDEYKPARLERLYHRTRIGFSSGPRAEMELGIQRLRRLLDSGDTGYDATV
ncbi:MAG: PLP-dependent aminotransferase family protein [Pseudomonadota bacterium]